MREVRVLARLFLLLAALLLPSCVELTEPLSDPDTAKPDARLFGVWKLVGDGQDRQRYGYLFVGKSGKPDAPPGMMKMVMVQGSEEDSITGEETAYLFPTTLGNGSYANFVSSPAFDRDKFPAWDKKNVQRYTLLKYAVEKDALAIWQMDTKAAETAVRNGQLKGTIEERGFLKLKFVTLTSAADLARLLAGGGDRALFPDANKILLARRVK